MIDLKKLKALKIIGYVFLVIVAVVVGVGIGQTLSGGQTKTTKTEAKQETTETALTQEQVEERSGFSQFYISDLERGRRNPTIISLYELANAIGVRVADLIDETEFSPSDEPGPRHKRGPPKKLHDRSG